jgi:UDP-glucose 4-epimerase
MFTTFWFLAAECVKQLVFSSSATVYGEDALIPYIVPMPKGKTWKSYGTSKAMVEQILTDLLLCYLTLLESILQG